MWMGVLSFRRASKRPAGSGASGSSYYLPRSPKLNGAVERAQRTHTEEFYQVNDFSLEVAPLNRELLARERVYNTIRPHQAIGYLTPWAFWQRWRSEHPPNEENGTSGAMPAVPFSPCTSAISHPIRKEAKCHLSTGRVQEIDTGHGALLY